LLGKRSKDLISNILLMLVSIFISLLILEIGLRLFFPRYQSAARFYQMPYGVYPRHRPSSLEIDYHPDTGIKHPVVYNNLGLRQSWNIYPESDKGRLRIGVFGDSFVENRQLSIEYGFVNVLDYLLNSNENKFEVINFGNSGYGTDDSYLNFLQYPIAKDLSFSFYVFCNNDIGDIYQHHLISIDKNGDLIFIRHQQDNSLWKKCVSKLYLTYFLLDVKIRFINWYKNVLMMCGMNVDFRHSVGRIYFESDFYDMHFNDEIDHVIRIYRAILQKWSKQSAARHSPLTVVLLPFHLDTKLEFLTPNNIDRLNLYALLKRTYPDTPRIRFYHDGHWNETGNMIAAIFLYRYLEAKFDLPHRDDHWVKQRLFEYYSAFDKEWFPDFNVEEIPLSEVKEEAIRSKYRSLSVVKK